MAAVVAQGVAGVVVEAEAEEAAVVAGEAVVEPV